MIVSICILDGCPKIRIIVTSEHVSVIGIVDVVGVRLGPRWWIRVFFDERLHCTRISQ